MLSRSDGFESMRTTPGMVNGVRNPKPGQLLGKTLIEDFNLGRS
jgi:hypothetical protein